MSFTDLMSSARGPGVIGIILAMVVLIGFATLFVFAFDEGLQGDQQTIDATIRSNSADIQSYADRLGMAEKQLKEQPKRIAQTRELGDLKRQSKIAQTTVQTSQERVETIRKELDALGSDFEAYKDRYRTHIRGLEIGKNYDELRLRDGTIYTDVEVREVTAIGIQVRHSEGLKRIPFEDLSDELQDHFQFDPAQKAEALAKEMEERAKHDDAVTAAQEVAQVQRDEFKKQEFSAAKEKAVRDLAFAEAAVTRVENEIKQLESDLAHARSAAASARARGNVHMDQSKRIQGQIQAKRNQLSGIHRRIQELRAASQ